MDFFCATMIVSEKAANKIFILIISLMERDIGRCPFSIAERRVNMNLKALASKLQKALLMKGRKIKINQIQVYFEEEAKMATKYIVIENKEVFDEKTRKYKIKDVVIDETYSMADVVKLLAILYGGDKE